MNLAEITKTFYDLTGRVDLSSSDVKEYIKSGQRFLDDTSASAHLSSTFMKQLVANTTYYTLLTEPKLIESVSLYDSFGAEKHLIKLDIDQMKLESDQLPAFNSPALPDYYTLASFRHTPDGDNITTELGSLAGKVPVIETDSNELNGLIFNCPTDKDYVLEVKGQFYTKTLVQSTDSNFWSNKYPFTLVHAALYKLEVGYRNKEGANDWLAAIKPVIGEILNNKIEEEVYAISKMEG